MNWFRTDLSLKIGSLVLALFVWAYLRTEARTVQVFQVPLELADLPSDYALVGDLPDSVSVRIRASDSLAQTLSPGRFQARTSLAGAQPGEQTISLTSDIIRAPFGVEVLKVDPSELQLEIEKLIMREVPIVAHIEGAPASGFEYVGHTLKPDNASIEGPESLVAEVMEVRTELVDIEGREGPLSTTVALIPDRGGIRIVNAETTILHVDILPQKIARRYDDVSITPVLTDGTDYKVTFRPQTVTVVLEGTEEVLDGIHPGSITAYLDLEGMNPRDASYTVRPRVVVADGGADVTVASISAGTIEVTIHK